MNIRILELIDGAKAAKGLTVVIDVLRAMTVEAKQSVCTQSIFDKRTGVRHEFIMHLN